jgi:hypothetical protein
MSAEPNMRLPVKRQPAPPPAVWRQAAPVVARGAALVVAGVVGEWLLRSATKRALALPFQWRKRARKGRALSKRGPAGEVAVSETVIVHRVIVRR